MRIIIFILGLTFLCGCGLLPKPQVDLNLLKAQEDAIVGVKNKIEKVDGDMSIVKAELPELKKLVEANIKLQADIKAQIETTAKAYVGYQKDIHDIKTTVGGDYAQTTQTTNEAKLMMYIIGIMGGIIMALITGFFAIIKMYIKTKKEKEQRELEKKYYKDHLLLSVKTEEEYEKVREEHDKFVNGRTKSE